MQEETYRLWDTIIKVVGFIGVIASFVIGWYQFNGNLEKEYKKPFWEAQLKVCQKAVVVTAKLARSENKGKVSQEYLDSLFNIYHGEAILLMNKKAFKSLQEMAHVAYQCNKATPQKPVKGCIGPNFNGLSQTFSAACRDMIVDSSGLDFEKMDSSSLRNE
ncbi:MAG: hypothetical protein ACJAS1_004381 [Oleiphilaceae bacterium]|jgi:hypothetical protein